MKDADAENPALPKGWSPLTWLTALTKADTPEEVAGAINRLVQAWPGCRSACVLWKTDEASPYQSIPPSALDDLDLSWVASVVQSGTPYPNSDGSSIGICLSRQSESVLLLALHPEYRGAQLAEEFIATLALAGQQLCRALEWSGLRHSHRQLERSEALQRALFAISELVSSERDMPEMLRGLHSIVRTLMYAENFFIVTHDPERDSIRFLYFVDTQDATAPGEGDELPLSTIQHSATWYVMRERTARMGTIEELRQQITGPLTIIGSRSFHWMGVPMVRDGQLGGALVVQSYVQSIGYTLDDQALLEFVGTHILTALERRQSTDDLEHRVTLRTTQLAEANRGLQLEILERQRSEHLQSALFRIAQLATADIDQNEFYRRVHSVVGELLNAENFYIALLSDDGQELSFPYSVDAVKPPSSVRPLGRGLSEYVLRRGSALRANDADIRELERRGEISTGRVDSPSLCWLGVPLVVGDEVIGLVAVQSYVSSDLYGPTDQELLSFVASQIAHALERRRSAESLKLAYEQLELRVEERTEALRKEIVVRKRIQDQLKHQVVHDALTGLPNRSYLRERIDRVLGLLKHQSHRRCALLYLDIDRFKVINDSLGHLSGDEVLKEVATRLSSCVRHPDLVARLSGDEFTVLLEKIDAYTVATSVAQRMLDVLNVPMPIAGKELQLTGSIGIAICDWHYENADAVLRDADIALYRAKQLGRKRFELFDQTLADNVVDVLSVEVDLRHALQNQQFEPYFQPICRLADGQIVGYEALIRWNHPQRGLLHPRDFIKIAEDSGLIEAIDWHIFELSCRLLAQHGPHDAFMTFNVSALHLSHEDFDARLIELLERTGLPPTRLIAEVTEGALLDNPGRVRATLDRLRMIGVGAALDDFGTGYSSLSYLNSLPLRMLKIDRAFVQELDKGNANSTTVVGAILALAHALGIEVIAEGIETAPQREALIAMGCELGQGYLLGHPAPIQQWRERTHGST